MEDSLLCPSHKYNFMELLPILMDTDQKEEITLVPSRLNQELQMSTEERLLKLSKPTRKYRISTEVNTFSRTPDIVVFQNFQPGLMYKTTLTFLNLHPVSRHLRVVSGHSPYLDVEPSTKDCSARLAPGMSYTLNVCFFPTENRNYINHITVMTDGEQFTVPVYGLSSQALLNLPDEIKLQPTVINVVSDKKLLLHNFGKTAASCVIVSKKPFSVCPYKFLLPASEFMEIRITCKSSTVGLIKDTLNFYYNDIKLSINIECEVQTINLYLDKGSISFGEIYIGLRSCDSVTVYNRSSHCLDFKWKLHKSQAMDELENSKMIKSLEGIKKLEKKRSNKLETMHIIDNEGHSQVLEKMFEDDVTEINSGDMYLYQHSVFDIIPLVGKILPNQSQLFTISFCPNKNKNYESWPYLEVTGRRNRLPLKLSGTGRGPFVSLNVKTLNTGDIFLHATHTYEVAVKNEGNIPATVVFKGCVCDFNCVIKCVPKKVYLPHQDSCSAFIISFYSEVKGKFIETVDFYVKESEEIIYFVLSGNVVCPLLRIDIRELDFGVFPYGINQMREFQLINDCQVPIDFKIVQEEKYSHNNEIEFNPDHGIVEAYTRHPVTVRLNSLQNKEVITNFKVIMWHSDQYSISRVLKYTCICPRVTCHPSEVKIMFCFLNYEYKRVIKLRNEDNIAGLISYTPGEHSERSNIKCNLSKTEFDIQPNKWEEIELSIITNVLGLSTLPLIFTVAGNRPQELCRITLDGQGPVISYHPEDIKFYKIQLLHLALQTLTLVNDSPIPALVTITKAETAFFEIDTTEVTIMPDKEVVINISAYLTDVGKYFSILNVSVHTAESIDIKVSAEGIGHPLLIEPFEDGEYDAKTILTHQHFSLPVKITNMGKMLYKLRITPHPVIRHLKDKLDEPFPGNFFRIKPEHFELCHLGMQTLELQGMAKEPKQVEEDFYVFALLDKSIKMIFVTSFKIKAKFVEPAVSITKPVLDVLVPEDDCLVLEDSMSLVNDLNVPVCLNLSTNNDYFIVPQEGQVQSQSKMIEGHEEVLITIKFAPNVAEKRYFKRFGELTVGYANHPVAVKLELSTEVCYPTVSLNVPIIEFNCIPLNSYSYKTIMIQNITFLPAKYTWEILENIFEIETLPQIKGRSRRIINDIHQYLEDSASEDKIASQPLLVKEKEIETVKEEEKEKVLIKEELSGDETKFSIVWTKEDYYAEMRRILLPPTEKFADDWNEQELVRDVKCDLTYDAYDIRNIITIEPSHGILDPYECGIATIGFYPPPNTRIQARLKCNVHKGEFETLTVTGTSCSISYEFEKEYVEFGTQLFCEVAENTIVMKNTGFCLFSFSVICDEVMPAGSTLEPGWLNVTPKSMSLHPDESVTFKIKYFPGIVGEFCESFIVSIGYLEPFEIKIHGYAVFTQLFAYVPRPIMSQQPQDVLYRAISTLTMHYLQMTENVVSSTPSQYNIGLSDSEIMSRLGHDWVVISKDENYPSVVDIDLSIERILMEQFILENPETLYEHSFTRKLKIIPDFKTPPYLLDFGNVVVGTSVCYTVMLLNYGPSLAEVRLIKDSISMDKNKFQVEFSLKKINPGCTGSMYVIFQPSLKKFLDIDIHIQENMSLIVSHGATIPFLITATVTLPRLSFEHNNIDFGKVYLGYCLRKTVVIKNEGYVISKWTAESKKKNTFLIHPRSGKLPPGKKALISIYFMPTVKDYHSAKLLIHLEGSPKKTSINMVGYGVESGLVFNNKNLTFKSALPYTEDSTLLFVVQNVASHPIEFCFADFDEQYKNEKQWIDLYLDTHHVKQVFIPQRFAGDKLHEMFEYNYTLWMTKLTINLAENSGFCVRPGMETVNKENLLTKYSKKELTKMLAELIELYHIEEGSGTTDLHDTKDDFYSSTTIVEPQKNKSESKKSQCGVFIVFHGAKHTEYYKAASRAGISLNIPIYSIDKLIYEALLAENQDQSINKQSISKLNKIINETYENVAIEEDLEPQPDEDNYDILMRKVYVVLTRKPKPKKKEKNDTKSNKTSEKSSGKQQVAKKDKEPNTLLDLPVELFEDILKIKFKSFPEGVIIESLHSDFLRTFHTALNALLCAFENSKYIHVIILSYTLQDYIADEQERISRERELSKSKETNKKTDKESRPTSEKSSKNAKDGNEKASDFGKLILKNMTKDEKANFDNFQDLLSEVYEMCQFWDKKNCSRMKAENAEEKKKIKNESKEDGKEVKTPHGKKRKSVDEMDHEGLYLWIMSHANQKRGIDFSEIICNSLKDSNVLKEAKKELAEQFTDEEKESSVLFSVLTKSTQPEKVKSEFFVISQSTRENEEKVGVERSNVSLLSLKGSGASKKKFLKHKSVDEKSGSSLLEKECVTPSEFISRHIIQPDEVQYYKFTFCPDKYGQYTHDFTIQITESNMDHIIKCKAVCELPKIDLHPHVLYPNVLESYRDKAVNTNFVYITEMNVLDFGLVFCDWDKPRLYECKLLLKNISQLICEVRVSVNEKSAFFIRTNTVNVDPGKEVIFPICIKAAKPGVLQSDLCISVKNNPKSYLVNLVSKACKLDFHIKPKSLLFDKVPVNCGLKKRITLTNMSPITLLWKFVDVKWASQVFTISRTEGSLWPFSVSDITFFYHPVVEESHPKKQIVIQVFDPNYSSEVPIYTDSITLHADSTEWHVDYKEHIDLGEVKGKKDIKVPFTLMNKGPYNICINFTKINNPLDNKIRKCFELTNTNETLLPNKLFTGNLIFKPTKPMEFKEVPIFVCNLVECTHAENVMNAFVVKVSAKVYLSSFTLIPTSDINFGYQQVFSTKTIVIELLNTGKFPFTFTIEDSKPEQLEIEKSKAKLVTDKNGKAKTSKSEKGSSKKSKESKDDKKKKPVMTSNLQVGCFSVGPSTGEILPNESEQLTVECSPSESKEYQEAVTLFVSEPNEEDVKGRQITLTVISCEPLLNFENCRRMFRENYIVDKLENLNSQNINGSHCIYESSELTLHFKKVCLNTKMTSNIYLQNTGHVTAHVTTKIEEAGKSVFKVSPQIVEIHPFSTKCISVIFKPETVGETNSRLEIAYNSTVNNKFLLTLVGEGLIPKITLVEPPPEKTEDTCINFPPTYVGNSKRRRISIKNVGTIPGKAILEICNNVNDMLALQACEDTTSFLNIPDLNEFQHTNCSTLVNLQPDHIANFDLIFSPDSEESVHALIRIYVINNPFETSEIPVNAQSFYHNIYLEGLPPYLHKFKNIAGYNIDMGYCFLNHLQKKIFSIKNNSDSIIYKFEFATFGALTFTPRIGHLKPLASKEVIATFWSSKPQFFKKEVVQCTINKIQYLNPNLEDLSWDERQVLVTSDVLDMPRPESSPKLRKPSLSEAKSDSTNVVSILKDTKGVGIPEPGFELIPGSTEVIPCYFSVVADYASYTNEIGEIIFPPLYVNEKKEVDIEIGNDGNVPLDIEWNFTENEVEEIRPSSARERHKTTVPVDNKDLTRASSATSLFSSDCSSCSCMEEQSFPFTIHPQKVSIHPGSFQKFTIQFAPLKFMDYCVELRSCITCLKPKMKNIHIRIRGRSLIPVYYLELEESDYLNRRPDGVKKCGAVEHKNPRIIEFESIGIGVPSTRKFNVVNPGKAPFTYKFSCLTDEQFMAISYFDCKVASDFVLDGKKSEVTFVFKPQEFGNFEESYMFEISAKNISVPFLLAGKCRQPSVYFTKSSISMNPTILMVPTSTMLTLRNDDDVELSFKFLKESLFNENQDQELKVFPKIGKLKNKSELPIKVTYKGEITGNVNFYLQCYVEKLPLPLTLNIFAQCVEVLSVITYSDKVEAVTNSLDKDNENFINFGTIIPKRREMLKFTVANIGQTGFFYTVQFDTKPIEHQFCFDVNQKKEFVPSCRNSNIIIYLEALRRAVLKDFRMKIHISYGPTYLLNINAKAEIPLIKFSFNSYNFGYCIVQKIKSSYYNASLEVKNIGTRVLLLENCYDNKSDIENLTIDFKSGQIRPCSSQHIGIYFHPLKVGRYEINVPFKVNSVKYNVKILGEAVNINLQLVNKGDKFIDLGGIMVGTEKKYIVQIVNQTPTQISGFFDLWQRLPFHSRQKEKMFSDMKLPDLLEPTNSASSRQKKEREASNNNVTKEEKKKVRVKGSKSNKEAAKKEKKEKKEKEKDKEREKKIKEQEVVQEDIIEAKEEPPKTAIDFLKISPRDCVQIGPEKKHQFLIEFMPTERIKNFSEQIFYEIQDHIEALCMVQGYCVAPEFVLSEDHIRFSNVVVGFKHKVMVLLRNTGDFKGRFQFILKKGYDVFTIAPLTGIVGASSELEISVTFAPKVADCLFMTKAKCLIEGLEKTLEMTLEGNSTKVPPPLSTLQFMCPVREATDQQIKIVNVTKDQWIINPILSSEHFAVAREIMVDREAEHIIDVTYKPELMTTLTPHIATLFLPLPEGKAIIYKLIGKTQPPLPINRFKIDIRSKINNTHILEIQNWLNTKQCFKVSTELITPLTSKCLFKASGNPLVELFPSETKEYSWTIYVINDIPLDFRVIFTNIETNEYMYYEISTNVLPSGPLDTIIVSTCVRKPVEFTIMLENPVDKPVTFTIDCDLDESTYDQILTVEPYNTRELTLLYCPLKSDDIITNLNATCPELGTFTYCLKLLAKPPLPENTVKFKTELGEKTYKSVFWKNTFKAPVEFVAKFDHPVFSMEKIPPISEGETGRLRFAFEPSELGTLQSKGILFSPQTGNYIYPLIGECILPTPKGPFCIKPGGSLQINFVNPFTEDQTFNFLLDSDAFYLKVNSELIKAKKTTKIVVYMQTLKNMEINSASYQITAKLHVDIADSPDDNIRWIYYIQSDI